VGHRGHTVPETMSQACQDRGAVEETISWRKWRTSKMTDEIVFTFEMDEALRGALSKPEFREAAGVSE